MNDILRLHSVPDTAALRVRLARAAAALPCDAVRVGRAVCGEKDAACMIPPFEALQGHAP